MRSEKEQADFEKRVKENPLDPKWVDIILGKSDSVRMREAVDIIKDSSKTLDERITAFDELELLTESIDNANDLRTLGLWPPILDLMKSAPEPDIRSFAAWVSGTAVQNNPKSQKDFIDLNGLSILVSALSSDTSPQVLSKLLFLASSLSRNNPNVDSNILAPGVSRVLSLDLISGSDGAENEELARAHVKAVWLVNSWVLRGGVDETEARVAVPATEWVAGVVKVLEGAVERLKRGDGAVASGVCVDLVEKCITVLTGLAGTGYKLDSSLSARISVLFPTLVKWSSPTKDSNGLQIDADIQSLQLLTLAEFKK